MYQLPCGNISQITIHNCQHELSVVPVVNKRHDVENRGLKCLEWRQEKTSALNVSITLDFTKRFALFKPITKMNCCINLYDVSLNYCVTELKLHSIAIIIYKRWRHHCLVIDKFVGLCTSWTLHSLNISWKVVYITLIQQTCYTSKRASK